MEGFVEGGLADGGAGSRGLVEPSFLGSQEGMFGGLVIPDDGHAITTCCAAEGDIDDDEEVEGVGDVLLHATHLDGGPFAESLRLTLSK